jgi:hypothetical protein
MGMRILSVVLAGVLALSFSGSTAWAHPASLALGVGKAPAHGPGGDSTKPGLGKKPGKKGGGVNLGSAARQELLKNKAEQSKSKSTKPKSSALSKKPVLKKS